MGAVLWMSRHSLGSLCPWSNKKVRWSNRGLLLWSQETCTFHISCCQAFRSVFLHSPCTHAGLHLMTIQADDAALTPVLAVVDLHRLVCWFCPACAGTKVTAGTLNCDGSLMVAAEASGQDTAIADIVRMVEAAQARTAPIQRLADSVAGKFAYGVMGLSAATFTFWSTIGARVFPQVVAAAAAGAAGAAGSAGAAAAGACCCPPAAGTAAAAAVAATGGMASAGGAAAAVPAAAAVLLGLQLACNVLVVACPCALGLAAPTAVLVGTAAGARKGLLVRGGDILEATSQVIAVPLQGLVGGVCAPKLSSAKAVHTSVTMPSLSLLCLSVAVARLPPVLHCCRWTQLCLTRPGR